MAAPSVMPLEKLKPLLKLSKREPVQAAIGLTKDGDGLILLHKTAKPRKVLSMLRAAAGKADLALNGSTLRFGRALVDPEYDPSTVRFFVNKEAPGMMRAKLVLVVRLASFQKVEFNVDASLEDEPEDDGEEAGAEPQAGSPPEAAPSNAGAVAAELATLARRIPAAAGRDAGLRARLLQLATQANDKLKANQPDEAARFLAELRTALDAGAPEPGTQTTGTGTASADALRTALTALAGRIAAGDPARKAELAKLAMACNAALKAGDLAGCAAAIGQLRTALDAGGPGGGASAAWAKAASAWRDANDAVNDQVNALAAAIRASIQAQDEDVMEYAGPLAEIADKGLNALTSGYRVKLMAAVQDLADGGPAAMGKFGAPALGQVASYQAFLQGSDKIAMCDGNPFGVAVAIRATLLPALQQMAAALQSAAPKAA